MYKVTFKAQFAYASIEKQDNYYLVGLAEDEFDYETIMSKRPQTSMNIAHDSFITDKKQIIY